MQSYRRCQDGSQREHAAVQQAWCSIGEGLAQPDCGSPWCGIEIQAALRCSGAPLMAVIGGNYHMPMQERTCRMCKEQCVEDAEHFVSKCGFFAVERRECLRRLDVAITGEYSPVFRQAMEDNDVD